MAIGTNAAVWFFGTQDDLDDTSALIVDGGFSNQSGDLVSWTNDDDATHVAVIVELTMNVAADDNSGVNLYIRALNVEGTNDDSIPEAEHRRTFLGFFGVLNGITTIQRSTEAPLALPVYKTSSVWEFYLENKTGETIDAGWTVFVTPMSLGPHA